MQQGLSDPLISITQSGVIGVNGWQAYEKSLGNLFSFEKDPSLMSDKYLYIFILYFTRKTQVVQKILSTTKIHFSFTF